jgi:hypothetical protein
VYNKRHGHDGDDQAMAKVMHRAHLEWYTRLMSREKTVRKAVEVESTGTILDCAAVTAGLMLRMVRMDSPQEVVTDAP